MRISSAMSPHALLSTMNLAEAVDTRGSTKLLKLISGTHKQPVTSPMMMPSLVSARCAGIRLFHKTEQVCWRRHPSRRVSASSVFNHDQYADQSEKPPGNLGFHCIPCSIEISHGKRVRVPVDSIAEAYTFHAIWPAGVQDCGCEGTGGEYTAGAQGGKMQLAAQPLACQLRRIAPHRTT